MSKRLIGIAIIAIMLLGVFGFTACGGDGKQKLTFKLSKDPNYVGYVVTGGRPDKDGNLVIPNTHKHKPVVYVYSESFQGNEKIKSVIIRAVLQGGIASSAFEDAINLKKIIFENDCQLISIGGHAFKNTGIENIILPKSIMHIAQYAFAECKNLKSVVFEEGSELEVISFNAFENCINLEYINFPASLRSINEKAFKGCHNLKQIEQEENSKLHTIMHNAFCGATSLKTFTIPYSVIMLGSSIFCGWDNTQTIYVQGRSEPPDWILSDYINGFVKWLENWDYESDAQVVWNT